MISGYDHPIPTESRQVKVMSGNFLESTKTIHSQINLGCFEESEQPQIRELMLMIAEIYSLPPEVDVQISGQKLPCALVKEVYSMLTEDHLRAVIENFNSAAYQIKFKKTYLRTAMYNEVFEHESRIANGFSVHFPEFKDG